MALALTAVTAFPADAAAPVADVATTAPLAIAGAFLDQLDAGDFAGAEARFTVQMASAVPAAKLKAVWDSLPQQAGPAKGRGEARLAKHDDMHVVIIPLHHEKAELLAQIAIDADGRIAGFLVQPAPPPPAAAPASDA
ncbi:MAG TPA: DUF3887 domain-containing protein, partial [Lysobacter sp.]|nr:DUF3887 domain-containing protein [Lysobacter sp.]